MITLARPPAVGNSNRSQATGLTYNFIGKELYLVFLLVPLFFTTTHAAELTPRPEPVKMLDAAGVDESFRSYIQQSESWDAQTEDEILFKTLGRLPDFTLKLCERWAFPWDAKQRQAVEVDPSAWLGQFFRLRFTVLTLQKVTLSVEEARWFGFEEYYCLQVDLDGSLSTLFARTVPKAWQEKKKLSDEKPITINEPGSAVAMYLKTGVAGQGGEKESSKAQPAFYFAADRIAWHPKTVAGLIGMDVGLFDLVEDQQVIGKKERETFYQLLAAVFQAKPGELMKLARAELGKGEDGHQKLTPAASLFNSPKQMRGRLVLLSGNVRRAIRVEVRDPDIVERFGIRHYYELYLYTPDSQHNPIVVCVRDLPKEMPTGSGLDYREHIEVAGIVLKSWAFASKENVREEEGEKRQLAPLVIAREPIWIPSQQPSDSPWPGMIAATAVVLGLFVLWYFLRRQAKADRAAKRRRQNL